MGSVGDVVAMIRSGVAEVDLLSGRVGDEGAAAIAAALAESTSLKSIYLAYNYIGVSGAKALAAAFTKSTSIQIIDTRSNCIGDEGASSIASAVSQSTTIRIVHARREPRRSRSQLVNAPRSR